MKKKLMPIARGVRAAMIVHARKNLMPVSLAGSCAMASASLVLALKRAGIKASFMLGRFIKQDKHREDHCWVEVGDWIIDLTATQFDIADKVFMTKANDPRYIRWRKDDHAVRMVTKLWPDWQTKGVTKIQRRAP